MSWASARNVCVTNQRSQEELDAAEKKEKKQISKKKKKIHAEELAMSFVKFLSKRAWWISFSKKNWDAF